MRENFEISPEENVFGTKLVLTVSLHFQCIVEATQNAQFMDQIHSEALIPVVTGEWNR